MVKKDLDTIVTVDKIVDTLMVDEVKYQEEINSLSFDELNSLSSNQQNEEQKNKIVDKEYPYGYLHPEEQNMVYKVPPYNDELDTNEAADYYGTTNDKRAHPDSPEAMNDKVNFMDTYESIHGVRRIDITFDQYKSDLKESFTDGIDCALTLSVGGKQDTPDEAFNKFFKDHSFRRKI